MSTEDVSPGTGGSRSPSAGRGGTGTAVQFRSPGGPITIPASEVGLSLTISDKALKEIERKIAEAADTGWIEMLWD